MQSNWTKFQKASAFLNHASNLLNQLYQTQPTREMKEASSHLITASAALNSEETAEALALSPVIVYLRKIGEPDIADKIEEAMNLLA